MASGTSWASAGEIAPTRGKATVTAVKKRTFRRVRVILFIVRSCGSGALPRVRQSGRTLGVTKLAGGKAKKRTKFVRRCGPDRFAAPAPCAQLPEHRIEAHILVAFRAGIARKTQR